MLGYLRTARRSAPAFVGLKASPRGARSFFKDKLNLVPLLPPSFSNSGPGSGTLLNLLNKVVVVTVTKSHPKVSPLLLASIPLICRPGLVPVSLQLP